MGIILTIDCGTTSTRAIIFNSNQSIIYTSQRSLPLNHPQSDWVEQCPNDIWNLTNQCLQDALNTNSIDTISAIAITNQRETAIIWNKRTGEPIGPAISWQCRRTSTTCTQLSEHASIIRKKTGLPLDPYFTATKFQWLLNYYPETKSLIENEDLCFGTVDTWLLWKLTNGASYATDITNASRTMLFNIHSLTYDNELCKLFNIPLQALPNVHPSSYYFGDYIHSDGASIPINGIIGDQQAALFAQCGRSQNMIKNTYGTGLFLMANTGQTVVQSDSMVTTIAIGINHSIDYAIEGSVFTGGSLIQWLRDDIGILNSAEESESLAKSIPNSNGVTIIPALTGLGTPHWKPDATGTIMGLTRSTSRAHIIRAALESIALQTHDIIDYLYQECPELSFDLMRVDGGAAKNNWLMQFQSDISNLVIERPDSIEATAFGAAICAANTSSSWPEIHTNISAKFSPKMSAEKRSSMYSDWQNCMHQQYR